MATTEKKSNRSPFAKGCLGCIGVIGALLLLGSLGLGVLVFYEKSRRNDHSNEHLIVPVKKGVPTKFRILRQYETATYMNVWVRGPGLIYAKGSLKCTYYKASRDFDSMEDGHPSKTDGPKKHIWLNSFTFLSAVYKRRPADCVVTFKELKSTGPVEIVVTGAPGSLEWLQ